MSSGELFHFSIVITANEYFLGSVLAYWTLSPWPPAACLVHALPFVAICLNMSVPLFSVRKLVNQGHVLPASSLRQGLVN
jgi:hypothetical protein